MGTTDENIVFIKTLYRAMQRSDIKKGLISKFIKSRSETLYRLIAKNSQTLSLETEDVAVIKNYLYNFSTNTSNNRKRRAKVSLDFCIAIEIYLMFL